MLKMDLGICIKGQFLDCTDSEISYLCMILLEGKPVSRHLSLKEKARRAEENMLQDIENGNFTPGPYLRYH